MAKELVLKKLKREDYDYVFVFKHNDDWSQLPPPPTPETKRSTPFKITLLFTFFSLAMKKSLGLI